jgi:hypothetical protein
MKLIISIVFAAATTWTLGLFLPLGKTAFMLNTVAVGWNTCVFVGLTFLALRCVSGKRGR